MDADDHAMLGAGRLFAVVGEDVFGGFLGGGGRGYCDGEEDVGGVKDFHRGWR